MALFVDAEAVLEHLVLPQQFRRLSGREVLESILDLHLGRCCRVHALSYIAAVFCAILELVLIECFEAIEENMTVLLVLVTFELLLVSAALE